MLRLFFLESIFTFLLLTLRRYTAADRLLVPEGIICPVVSVLAIILVPLVYLPPIDFIISCPSILLIKSVPAEGYSRNALWALNLISTFSFFCWVVHRVISFDSKSSVKHQYCLITII